MWTCVYCNEINETKQKQCCFCNCKRKKEDSKGRSRNVIAAASVAIVVLGLTTVLLATHGSQEPTDGVTESMRNETQTTIAGIQAESTPTTSTNAVAQPTANMQSSLSIPTASITPSVSATDTVPAPVSKPRQNETKQTAPLLSDEAVTSPGNTGTISSETYSASEYSNSTEPEYVEMDVLDDYEEAIYDDDPYELF
ncbi:MAG: hypothetical protein IJV30_07535 [Oscillospiraceae bacterium]|nr:hypothetical protein [Oscillospiraceae bacterium]